MHTRPLGPEQKYLRTVALSLAAVVFAAATPSLVAVAEASMTLSFVCVSIQSLTVIAAVRFPWTSTVVAVGVAVAVAVVLRFEDHGMWPVSQPQMLAIASTLFVAALRVGWISALMMWWLTNAVFVGLVVAAPDNRKDTDHWGSSMTATVAITLAVVAAAQLFTRWRDIRTELETARRDIRLEQMKTAYEQERRGIARDLHDLVAHSMSVIHMTAMSAPFRIPNMDDRIVREFEVITVAARSALQEMRQLMGALHSEGEGASSRPQPTITDIGELVAGTVSAGAQVRLDIDDAVADASNTLQLTVYRSVQEALSNAIRHSPGAPIVVSIAVETGGGISNAALLVIVTNGPTRRGMAPFGAIDHGGNGLLGIRERAELARGSMWAGTTDEGGFELKVRLPMAVAVTGSTT